MRARNIKPAFFMNEDLAECSPHARLFFVGLWLMSDRAGRIPWRSRRIKAELFPYEDVSVESLLQELASVKDPAGRPAFLVGYKADGVALVQVVNFTKHQRPYHKEPDSKFPPPSGANTVDFVSTSEVLPKYFGSTTEGVALFPDTGYLIPEDRDSEIADARSSEEESGEAKKSASEAKKSASEAKADDPLEGYPGFTKYYPQILEIIRKAHPSAKIPVDGSKQDRDWRNTLLHLVAIDGFTEVDVLKALDWLFKAKDEAALFWRKQVASLAPLRTMSKNTGLSKFASIHEAWKGEAKAGQGKPLTDEEERDKAQFERQIAEAKARMLEKQKEQTHGHS